MTTDISVRRSSFQVDDRSWLAGPHGSDMCFGVTLDVSAFTALVHYPNGYIPSGTPLAKIDATGLYAPYSVSEEVQTLTEGGSGLTSFTITYSGQTTGSIAAAATAATVQTALEALSNLAPGDVVVTGAAGGPYSLTFGGTLVDTNVAAVTATPTGGTGTVTVATLTAGGAEGTGGLEKCRGFLWGAVKVPNLLDTTVDVGGAMFVHGAVRGTKLPFTVDANGRADLPQIYFVD